MADQIDDRLDESLTEFGITTGRSSRWYVPSGKFGQWFSAFFAQKAKPHVAQQMFGQEDHGPLAGDTFKETDVIKYAGPVGPAMLRTMPHLPESERSRKKRYHDYEKMDEYPEVGSALDIYADDSSQENDEGGRWKVLHDNQMAIDCVEEMFLRVDLEEFLWDIIRNSCKYGDCFVENIIDLNDPKAGIQRIKILNPNYILRVENEYGYLIDFLQEIPKKGTWESYGSETGEGLKNAEMIPLDKNQVVHFRIHTSDPAFYPYGKGVASTAIPVFRSLKLMEDGMLIYRLARAPERRAFYIDVGNLPASKAESFIERQKQKMKKEKMFVGGQLSERYNPMSFDEDFFVPVRGNRGTKIETLQGAQNLGEVDDVKYFRDKMLAALKIPKDYVIEFDKSPERKANLSQLDVKFARTIVRVQKSMEIGLEILAKRHLQLKGFPSSVIKTLKIKLPSPSDMYQKRKFDIDEQKTRVVQTQVELNFLSRKKIYKDYYNMTDLEIEQEKKLIEEEAVEQANLEAMVGQINPTGIDDGPPEEKEPDEDSEAGGQESDENEPNSDDGE